MKKTPKESSPARNPLRQLAGERTVSHTSAKEYVLCLYVSGSTLKSARAVENIKRVCEEHLKSRYDLEVIDVYQQSNLARDERIVAVPTLIIRTPSPMRRLSGDLCDPEKLLLALDLKEPD